ncbi:penicillin-binding protein 1C [Sphingomonas baiyangensis]|uniref:peptidoglycan glycosyltransferase n=1 Tax=Sphingomonas baiyangensis TaxID=2572576 RepID=A0A4U1L830_9SPHN|nr:penicillin-binding protein 1C [Sphingomonas baiyangensis]TKD52924.1 penicillin-binding protein 1C [Sphingomonas baiyangensis]
MRPAFAAGAVIGAVALGVGLDHATRPLPLPDVATVRAKWQPSEAWLYDRHGRLIDSSRVDFAHRRLGWTPLDRVAPVVRATVIAAEDRRFTRHAGIDWLALAGSLRDRIEGKRVRGASTLSMQVAGMLAPSLATPGRRGVFDKLRQMRAGRAIERSWSKDAILEAYLNLAGFRGEAQGVGAAALGLFGKTPATLTRDDAALLAALLPDPAAPAPRLAARACAILRDGDCTRLPAQAAAMLGPARSLQLDPGLAPHLADRLLTRPGLRIATTLDARVQQAAIRALRRQLQGLGGTRARDGAVIVVDNVSGDVLAHVGGIGGASRAPAVDMAAAYRQAGSTLKPFLYAQAIERGYLTAASILDDSAVQLDTASGLYVPQNYDRAFKGPVPVRAALAGSLNVPAVRTLLLAGPDAFRDRLWDMGYRGLTEDGQYYGFSLALGSAEVTLAEQVAAFRALADRGRYAPLRWTRDAPDTAPRPVTSAAAAFIVADMLADPDARAASFGSDSALRLPFWAAVKTGTSKGMRDNWCIGFTTRFTVGVWIGNAEGDPMRAVSGTSGAAPVWRDLMLALHAGNPPPAPRPPGDVEAVPVRFAGGIAAPRREWFVRGTAQPQVAMAPEAARRPRITSPVAGSVYALDPDIPAPRQRLAVGVAGPVAGHRLRIDRRDLGPADGGALMLAGPGMHRLQLLAPDGRIVDQIRFTIR